MIDNNKDTLSYFPSKAENDPEFDIKTYNYSTSLDPRGYIPVHQYYIKDIPIMWDRETGYVHFTSIWKALGNTKTDIIKIIDANPSLKTKKIRGGFLQIQGTWVPFEDARLLCKRNAWSIKEELVPIFGENFPYETLSPGHKDFGCLLLDPKKTNNITVKKNKRSTVKKISKLEGRELVDTILPSRPKRRTSRLVSASAASASKASSLTNKTRMRNTKPYTRDVIRKSDSQKKPVSRSPMKTPIRSPTVSSLSSTGSDLSVSQSIDGDDSNSLFSDDQNLSSDDSSSVPSCRVVHTSNKIHMLPSINTFNSSHYFDSNVMMNPMLITPTSTATTPTPCFTPFWPPSPVSPYKPIYAAQENIDIVQAAIALQRLSQDNGKRPFSPFDTTAIPPKVVVNDQEFTILWD
ncbi:MAG: hypothetical protein EXX96DRAFT_558358 [Benjaminiella poitrasii]|nr:MAG: hypothetical protein EXX96DRAFT_558358 [Benjaminiella poitrasii]